MPFDVFNTYYMAGMIQEIVPPIRFFKDRYFQTGAADIFNANKVLVEYRDGDRRLAPFVVPRAGDLPTGRKGYELHELTPPSIIPSRLMTLDDLQKRGFGEALYVNSTPAERARVLQIADLAELDARIARREEWMAAQTMLNNGFTGTSYIDDLSVGEAFDCYFYDTSGSNPAIYTIADKWNAVNGNMFGDVVAMCDDLAKRGLPCADLIVGSDVWAYMRTQSDIKALLDNKRMEYGEFRPTIRYPGVTWSGHFNFDGYDLDIWVVKEQYTDDSGVNQHMFPTKGVLVTAPGCGHTMYARVDFMNKMGEFESIAAARVPEFIADPDKKTRKLRVTARPLTAPLHKAPWMYAANAVT